MDKKSKQFFPKEYKKSKRYGLGEDYRMYAKYHYRIISYIWPSFAIFIGFVLILFKLSPDIRERINFGPIVPLVIVFAIIVNIIYYKWRRKKEMMEG